MISFNFLGSESGKDELYKEVGQALIELASKYPHFSISVQGHGGTVYLSDNAEMDFASPAMLAYVLLALKEQTAAAGDSKRD